MIWVILGLSFLIGSVPTGLLLAKYRGVDIRKHGSGNIGATNVLRAVGKREALFTLVGDILKGVLAVVIGRLFLGDGTVEDGNFHGILCGFFAILGHDFSIFLRLKGGKGVATSLGVILAASPLIGVITAVSWVFCALFTKYSSLAALVSFLLMPVLVYFYEGVGWFLAISGMITGLLIYKHKSNVVRLVTGKEPKIGQKNK